MATKTIFHFNAMARWALGSTQLMLVIYGLYLVHLVNFTVLKLILMLGVTFNSFICSQLSSCIQRVKNLKREL